MRLIEFGRDGIPLCRRSCLGNERNEENGVKENGYNARSSLRIVAMYDDRMRVTGRKPVTSSFGWPSTLVKTQEVAFRVTISQNKGGLCRVANRKPAM